MKVPLDVAILKRIVDGKDRNIILFDINTCVFTSIMGYV